MAVRLSKRLTALAGMVPDGHRLADIGTDHGYIPIFLAKQGRIPSAIAMDVRPGPLSRAQEHVREWGLEGRIALRLSDGLENLLPGEADTVLIAGMGGALICRILDQAGESLEGVSALVLQPQSEIPAVRRFLRGHGWRIEDEEMVEEEGKFYPMMRAVRDGNGKFLPETEKADMALCDAFGPVLLARRHPVLAAWLERECRITDEILARLADSPRSEALGRRTDEMRKKKELLLQAKSRFMEKEDGGVRRHG